MQPCKYDDKIMQMAEDIAEIKANVAAIKERMSLSSSWKLAIVIALLGIIVDFVVIANNYGKLQERLNSHISYTEQHR